MHKIIEVDLTENIDIFKISAFLIPHKNGLVLVESGPHSTIPNLEKVVKANGFELSNITHVLLTHIHLDHAGGAWYLAEQGAKVYVHPNGYAHLKNPEKLLTSAAKLYGALMDELWGTLKPINENHLFEVADRQVLNINELAFTSHYTPGHATHHIAWQLNNVIFTGDVAGIRLNHGPPVPPVPPPDINIEDWHKSIERLASIENITAYYLTHGGKITDCENHLTQLKQTLDAYADFVLGHYKKQTPKPELIELFTKFSKDLLVKSGGDREALKSYENSNPSFMAVSGLWRYWKKKLTAQSST